MRIQRCSWTGNLLLVKSETQEISLEKDAFYRLKESLQRLETLQKSREKISLSDDGTLKAGWNGYGERFYLDIRKWIDDSVPTKQGVTLNPVEYRLLKLYLTDSLEMKMFKRAYAELLKRKVKDYMKTSCDGCAVQHGSQMQHSCVMTRDCAAVSEYVQKFGWRMRHAEVVSEAAALALKRDFCLLRPRETIILIETVMGDEIIEKAGTDEDVDTCDC
jgi:hypothetical protein